MMSKRSSFRLSALFVALLASLMMASVVVGGSASAAPDTRGEIKPWKPIKPIKKVKNWSKLNVQSPDNPSGMHNELNAIDCTGANCTAVGLWGPTEDISKPTFTRFSSKKSRSSVTAPTRVIPGANIGDIARAISCVGQSWCMVVGNTHKDNPADLTWSTLMSKGKWSKKATVTPSNGADGQAYLFGVKCTTTKSCIAVGHYFDTGADQRGLVLRWNGKQWKRVLASKFANVGLVGVDCSSRKNCVVVGSSTNGAKAFRIKNGKVSNIRGPAVPGNRLVSVSCVSEKWCGASGGTVDSPLAVSIKGNTFSKVGMGSKAKGIEDLSGISCSAVGRCTASSAWQDDDRFSHAAVWRWNRGNRKMTIMPGSSQSVGSLNAIDCQSTRCLAVGQNYIKGDMFYQLLNTAFQGPPN